ncbi:hypothetical protein GGX14DRAFT_397517 [Mycena pura]|uniref:Uncharacterized protein n=1 Tax=Mycena pura TaxID=153505 RepID=A0AAD6YCL2_9AGAR|nr:hypothetical protein GGX14DRAFT_397517 [Mycena pura]
MLHFGPYQRAAFVSRRPPPARPARTAHCLPGLSAACAPPPAAGAHRGWWADAGAHRAARTHTGSGCTQAVGAHTQAAGLGGAHRRRVVAEGARAGGAHTQAEGAWAGSGGRTEAGWAQAERARAGRSSHDPSET